MNSEYAPIFRSVKIDVAADLAKKAGADYVLVKPSYLFAYLMGHLIKTDTGGLIGNYVVETKGGDKKLTLKAVETLASKIDDNLDNPKNRS